MRVVFVGEAPAMPGHQPFSTWRAGAGTRLADLLGIKRELLHVNPDWEFHNLFRDPVEKWDAKAAKKLAWTFCQEHLEDGPWVLVMFGRQVARAFNHKLQYFEVYRFWVDGDEMRSVAVPHPSGRCRVWNDEANVGMFRKIMRELGVL